MKHFARFAVLAALVILGMPSLVSASTTVTCDALPLIATSPTAKAQLGWSLSAGQGWLAAGTLQDNTNPGSVALYKNPGTRTNRYPDQQLTAGDSHPGDQFGASVSISGTWMAVGAPGKAQNSGAVYLFKFDGTSWVQMAPTLSAADAAQGAQFGFSVALNGTTLVVGAPGDSDRGSLAGSVYVFDLQAPSNQPVELHANDGRPFDEFGFAVAMAGDNLVVGAPFADDTPHNVLKNFGAAYVFNAGNASNGWTQSARLAADDTFRGDNIQFGLSVAMSGGQILVGAPGDDLHNLTDSGSAFVFAFGQTQTGSSGWTRLLSLTPEDPHPGAQFGSSVLIDGDRLLIGARFDGVGNIGAAYLFNSGSGTQIEKDIGPATGGAFGQSVARIDGQIFMGGYLYDVDLPVDAGAVAVCPSGPSPQPDLICTKTGPTSVVAGDLVTYTIHVSNRGDAAATGVMLDDPTPDDLTLVSVSGVPGCAYPPCALGTIAANHSSNPVTVIFRVPDGCAAPRSIKNVAMGHDDATHSFHCTTDSPTAVIRPPAGLSCSKQGPSTAQPGDIVTYDIAVSNSGCEAAKNVMLSDPTPAGLSLVSVSGPCTQLPCDLGTLQPGQSLPPVMAKFQVAAGCPAPSSVTNLASVVGSNASEATCLKTTVVPPESDLGINVSAPQGVSGGNSFPVEVVVTNRGPQTALGTTVDVAITGASMILSFPPECTPDSNQPGHFTCLLGDMPCGAYKPLIFSVRAPSCVTCAAGTPIVVTADAMSQTLDPTLPNHAMAMIQVTCTLEGDLAITKEDAPDPVASGAELQYTITVQNPGCLDVLGATVTDVFPAGLTNVRWCREMGGPCNPNQAGDLNDTLSLAVGDSAIYLVKGTVAVCGGTLVNTATVSMPLGVVDSNTWNNTATATTTILSTPGVSIHCMGVPDAFEGDYVTFTYVLSNGGSNAQGDNPGAEFTDTLPAGLTLVTAIASSGTVTTAANTVSWNGSIPACGTVTISVQATVNSGTAGMTLCNFGFVAFDANGDGINESNANAVCCVRIHPVCTTNCGIPTLSPAGLAALILLLACVALLRLRRRSL